MKLPWLLVLMVSSAAAVDSTGYARVFHPRSELLASKAHADAVVETSYDRARDPRGEGDEAGGGHPHQAQNRPVLTTRGATKSAASRGQRKPPVGPPRHAGETEAPHHFRAGTPETAIDSGETRSPSAGAPIGAVDHDRRFVRSPVAAALNGQPLPAAHHPGAVATIRGGTAHSIAGTAAINGTNMKRKP